MTLLPIVERELRTRARRRFTYWSRLAAAAAVLAVLAAMYFEAWISNASRFNSGFYQFQVLKWICFAVACAAGLALTADSLSEEKREGTLGLLFLTDLRGYDIILGKLAANSVQAAFSLLAAFPVLAISLLAGGVTGREFWLTMLVILNTLLFSLSIGMWVSSISRDAIKAIFGTLFLLLVFLAGLPFADVLLAHWDITRFRIVFSMASPSFLLGKITFLSLVAATPGFTWTSAEWIALAAQFAAALAFLVLASVCVPFAWREKASRHARAKPSMPESRLLTPHRVAVRRRRLARDPVFWLAMRKQWAPKFAFAMAAAGLGLQIAYYDWELHPRLMGLLFVYHLFVIMVIHLCVVSQAARFFGDLVRNGSIELLLVTPVRPAQVVRSHWKALWRAFAPPTLCVFASLAFPLLTINAWTRQGETPFDDVLVVCELATVFSVVGTLSALAWVGMWMGLTTRKNPVALIKTIALVIVVPGALCAFLLVTFAVVQGVLRLIIFRRAWEVIAVLAALQLCLNMIFVFGARRRLMTRFSAMAAREPGGRRFRPTRSPAGPGNLAPIPNPIAGR